ncbi:MAG TPA: phosphate signaling complex protein PhoU [Firmicutes bacterium]|nr:phosphate signaling complex protein PhoU [Bacillota bacterium]
MLEERMTKLRETLVEYAALIERMLENSVGGLIKKRKDLLDATIERDEPAANDFEIRIDELSAELIAQYAPKAKNLRAILMVMKMGNDLERMGDHAVNIAESGIYLIERPMVKPLIDIPRMSEVAIGMLRDSVRAFIDEDAGLARSVCKRDETVDGLRDQILRELITFMVSDPTTIERSFHLIRVSSSLERVADLSTNICEDVIFMVKGEVIKHHHDEESAD